MSRDRKNLNSADQKDFPTSYGRLVLLPVRVMKQTQGKEKEKAEGPKGKLIEGNGIFYSFT